MNTTSSMLTNPGERLPLLTLYSIAPPNGLAFSCCERAARDRIKKRTISRAQRSAATFLGRALTPDQRNCPISRLGGYNVSAPEAQTHEWIGAFEPALQHGSQSRTPCVLVAF